MRVLGIDTETAGLDCKTDRIIEIAGCLWDWESSTPLMIYSALIDPRRDIPAEITELTGITQVQINEFGAPEENVLSEFDLLLGKADYAMAHNAPFDKGFYDVAADRCFIEKRPTIWLDTKMDIKYPERIETRNLNYLSAEMGFINPWRHRAIFDVMTMLKLASAYDIEQIIDRAKEPTLYVRAIVSFDEKEKAKERGYRWYPTGRIWWRPFKQSDYFLEKQQAPFETFLLDRAPE